MTYVPPEGENSSRPTSPEDTRNLGGQQIDPPDETDRLISARKVEGTRVFSASGENIGAVHDLMIDKRQGRVVYALLSLGGFLGIVGQRYHPVPWGMLTFNPVTGGYDLGVTAAALDDAPSLSTDELPAFEAGVYDRRVLDFYGADGRRSDLGPPL